MCEIAARGLDLGCRDDPSAPVQLAGQELESADIAIVQNIENHATLRACHANAAATNTFTNPCMVAERIGWCSPAVALKAIRRDAASQEIGQHLR